MRRRALAPLLGFAFASLALGQEREELTFRVELDPHQLAREVDRASKLLDSGQVEDGLALAEKLERDPRLRDGLVEVSAGRFVTLDRVLRERLVRLDGDARRAYDARHAPGVDPLEEQGTRRSLERLIALFPGSSRAGAAMLRSAELAFEAGDLELATARFEDAASAPALEAGEAERARIELPAAYALAGRRHACADALDRLDGDAETAARRLAASAASEREAQRAELAPVTTDLGSAAWVHETPDYFEVAQGGAGAVSEPVLDASRAYVHDASRCIALDLATGKLVFATPLRDDDTYRAPTGPCRTLAGDDVLACILPLTLDPRHDETAIVTLDRESGERLARITRDELKALAGAGETATCAVSAVLSGGVLTVALDAQDTSHELYLLGFDARSGVLLWRTLLGHMPVDLRTPRAAPALAAGGGRVFVLPGGWGVVAALDPETGGVAWLVHYTSTPRFHRPVPGRRGRQAFVGVLSEPSRAGFLACVRGRLLVAAPDAPFLRALDPRTGEVDWETEDEGGSVIATYREGVVEVVDTEGVVSVVGRSVWPRARVARNAQRLRAAVSGDVLLLPLGRGIVYRIALAAASEVREFDLPPSPPSVVLPRGPANLAVLDGRVVAAGTGNVVLLGEAASIPSSASLDPIRDLGDPIFAVREAAQAALAAMGSAVRPVLDQAALSGDAERASRARTIREALLLDERRARFLEVCSHASAERLLDHDPQVRKRTIDELVRTRQAAYRPVFEELCSDPDPGVAGTAAFAALGCGGRAGVPLIAKLALSGSSIERLVAMRTLAEQGSAEDGPTFVRGFKDENGEVRRLALVGAIAKGDARLAPEILRALDDDAGVSRVAVLSQAAELGRPNPGLAGPILRHFVHDEDASFRHRAVLGLKRVAHDPDAWLGLAEALQDPERSVRDDALTALLGELPHDDAPELGPGVMERILALSLDRREHNLGGMAMSSARRLLERGKVVRPGALARVALQEPLLERDALLALRRSVDLAAVDSSDVAAIASLTESPRAGVRREGYGALLRARGPGRGAVLVRGLDDADVDTRALVSQELPSCDTDVGFELIRLEGSDPRVTKVLDACEPRVLAFAALRAADSGDERLRALGLARLRAQRATLERLVRAETDPSIAARLREALARGSP